ncbi:MAG: hypothetical protein V5B39_00015 [Accumulibacter sp.]|uniref:hypothetical protein n=1 Tax=Accumulibacter sp. TaxID=2053492 RepID=UPI002FC33B3F
MLTGNTSSLVFSGTPPGHQKAGADIRRADRTLFSLDLETTRRAGADIEGVVAVAAIRQPEIQSDSKMCRVAAGTTPHLGQATAHLQCVFQGALQSVFDEVQNIQKVALARAVGTHQIRNRPEFHIARCDAPVILRPNAADENGVFHDSVQRSLGGMPSS